MAAEALEEPRTALGDEVERIAQVQCRHRAARALELARSVGGEGEDRAVEAVLEARGEQAHDARMPLGRVQRERIALRGLDLRHQRQGRLLHLALDLAA